MARDSTEGIRPRRALCVLYLEYQAARVDRGVRDADEDDRGDWIVEWDAFFVVVIFLGMILYFFVL